MDDNEEKSEQVARINGDEKVPFYKLFFFADIALMAIGTFGAIGDGLTQPFMTLILIWPNY